MIVAMVGGHDGSADVKVEQICPSQLSEVLAWPFIQDVAVARGAAGLFGDSVTVRSWSSVSVQFSQRAEIVSQCLCYLPCQLGCKLSLAVSTA